VISAPPRPLYSQGMNPVPIVHVAGQAPGPVWTGAENLTPTGIRSPDHPACNVSLYLLCYPSPLLDPGLVLFVECKRSMLAALSKHSVGKEKVRILHRSVSVMDEKYHGFSQEKLNVCFTLWSM
jgi:hypothetical protein